MADKKTTRDIIDKLALSISDDVGNMHEDELDMIATSFDKTLTSALKSFNSTAFDDDGFIKKMRDLDLNDKKDKDMVKNVLNNIRSDYIAADTLNHSELLMRRDMHNICTQMPEMRDVIYVIRDAIIECNVSSGDVSRSLVFENHQENEAFESQVKEIEQRFDLLRAIKNFIVPNCLNLGEKYVHVIPYSKLFAELNTIHDSKFSEGKGFHFEKAFTESVPTEIMKSFKESVSLYSEENVNSLMESVSTITKSDTSDTYHIDNDSSKMTSEKVNKSEIASLLKNIDVYNGTSVMLSEMGPDAFKNFVLTEYANNKFDNKKSNNQHFSETTNFNNPNTAGMFDNIDQDVVSNIGDYSHVKGCYIRYPDALRMVPIRMDRRIIGYYYVSTTMDLQTNANQPNGMIDLSFQHYTRDKNMVDTLANMIIKSFDKKMLEKNIKLKNEIAEVIMAHKFSEGKLSFIYIPENEVVRFVINEDEMGKGHSVIEPTLFPARMYLMLTMYNMLYTLNNNTTRVHYLKSSGLNKDYAAQIQRTMRKFQSRRITIDDIYSYSGVLNKVGGMGEMVLPAGRNDYKALETDTIQAVDNPINMEFLEQQRRQAISGTGVPHLMMINAIDEADFAKTLEMANARFISTVSSYKIDFNRDLTKLYRLLLKYCTDMEDDIIQSFLFKFNAVKQQELDITAEMITNFNSLVEMVMSVYYKKSDMEDEQGNPTSKQIFLRKELAKEYLPQLNFDTLDELIKRVEIQATDDKLQNDVSKLDIDNNDLAEVETEQK
jgi:hypothetical protein